MAEDMPEDPFGTRILDLNTVGFHSIEMEPAENVIGGFLILVSKSLEEDGIGVRLIVQEAPGLDYLTRRGALELFLEAVAESELVGDEDDDGDYSS